MDSQQLRGELTQETSADVRRRRGIIGASLVGAASMAVVSLLQMGVLTHLPDPPVPSFNSDRVNLSRTAYALGLPDGTLGVTAFAANLPLAGFGGADRSQTNPWVSLAATAKAAADAAVSLWYFYEQPTREHAWCAYCLTGQLAALAVFVLTIPEARNALQTLRNR